MKKKLKWIFGALAVVFVLLQLTNPARTNPPVVNDLMATNPPPPEIAAMLHAACYDCHSYETKWPWYSHIAPVSWLIASDVNGARRKVNFSDWPSGQPDWEARRLEDMSDEGCNPAICRRRNTSSSTSTRGLRKASASN